MSVFLRIQLEKIYMETLTELHSFYHRLIQNLFQYKTHPHKFQAIEGLIKMYAKYFFKMLTASSYAMHLKMVHNIFPFPQQSYYTKLYVMTSFSIVTSFGCSAFRYFSLQLCQISQGFLNVAEYSLYYFFLLLSNKKVKITNSDQYHM